MSDARRSARRSPIPLLACGLLALASPAHAQQATEPLPDPAPAPNVPTLDRVQALRPDVEALDLHRFENPITVDPNRFDQAYDSGISPEDMALHYGGYVNYGLNKGLYETWKGFKKVTGMRPSEQPAIARPPPLSEEQMRRAAACATEPAGCGTK